MKYLYIILISLCCMQCHHRSGPQAIIDTIANQFVPDARTGVFMVRFEYQSSKLVLGGETDHKEAHSALLKALRNAGYMVEDSIVDLPSETTQPWALVALSVASMRIQPSHDAELTTQATMGTPLRVLKETDDWALVQSPDKYLAWCEKDAIRFMDEAEFSRWKQSKRVIVTGWFDFLRDSATHNVVGDLVAGCILEYGSSGKNGTLVVTPDGRRGFIAASETAEFNTWKKEHRIPEDLVKTAKVFLGTPYLWGGASVKAIDCSGFVKTVYFLNGFILSRDASQQANYGTDIPLDHSSFLPGDLVFFGRHPRNGNPSRITHVGMYLGNTEFIHSSGFVKINSFDSTRSNYSHYRTISLLKARRILGNTGSAGIIPVKNHPWY